MFKCQVTGLQSASGERSFRIVTKTRSVTYPSQKFSHGSREVSDPGGDGHEIAEEIVVCDVGRRILRDFPETWREEVLKSGVLTSYLRAES